MKPLIQLLTRPLLHVAGISFFVNLLLLVPALFMLQVFDRVLASQSGETLVVLMIGVGVGLALLFALDYLRARLQGVAGNIVAESLSPVVTKIVIEHGARRSGRGSSENLRDVGSLRALFSAQGLLALIDSPWVFAYVAVIWLAHPLLGIAAACAAVLMLALAVINDVVTRREIEAHIYDTRLDTASNVVESAISALRKRLARPGASPIIHTRHGLGYILKADDAPDVEPA